MLSAEIGSTTTPLPKSVLYWSRNFVSSAVQSGAAWPTSGPAGAAAVAAPACVADCAPALVARAASAEAASSVERRDIRYLGRGWPTKEGAASPAPERWRHCHANTSSGLWSVGQSSAGPFVTPTSKCPKVASRTRPLFTLYC